MYQRRPYYNSSRNERAAGDRGMQDKTASPAQQHVAAQQNNSQPSSAPARIQAGIQADTVSRAVQTNQNRNSRPLEQNMAAPAMVVDHTGSQTGSQTGKQAGGPDSASKGYSQNMNQARRKMNAADIPMPYEPERYRRGPLHNNPKPSFPKPAGQNGQKTQKGKGFSLTKIFGHKIGIEEMILFALIVIFLDEGLDDEMLLLLLVYIFLDFSKN